MKTPLAMLTIAALLTGCATHSEPKPAVCDGKHRRPANPYGTVLPTTPDAKPSDGSPAAPPSSPGPQSSIDPKSFGSCGARV
jgi:hypothetical protein